MEELVLYNVKAMHQMKNVRLLAVEDAAVLEVIIFEQFGSDNQSMILTNINDPVNLLYSFTSFG